MTTAGSTLFVAFRLAGVTAAFLLAQQVCATVALPIFLSLLVAWTVGIDADLKNFVASDSRAASKEISSGKQNQKDGCSPDEKDEDDRPPGEPRERTSSSEHQKKHRKNSSHSAGSSKSNESSEADQYVKVKSSSASSASRPSATFSGGATTSGGPTRRKSRTESEESFELVDKDEGGGPQHGMNSKINAKTGPEKSTSMATNETRLDEQQDEDHSALKKPSSIPVLITKNPNSDNDEHEEQEDREVHYSTTDMTPMMNTNSNTGNVSTTEPEEPASSSTSNSPQLLFQQDARDETVDDKPGGLRTTKQDKKAVSGSTPSSSSSSNPSSNNKKATTPRKNSKNREDDSPKMIVTKAADYDYNSDDDEDHARSSDEDDMRGQQDQSSSPSPSTTRSRRKKSTSSSLNTNQHTKARSTSNQLRDGSPSKNQKHLLPATISGASSLSAGSVESVTVNDAGGDGENDFHKAADGVDGYFVGDDFTIKKGENHDRSPGSSVDISETGARDAGDLSSDEDVDQRQPSAKDDDDGNMFDPAKAAECKEQGNKYFKAGEFTLAAECYSDAIAFCPTSEKQLLAVYHANRAACYMSLDEVEMAIHDCTDAVEYDPSYVRAWQRKCTANEKKGRYHDALDDSKKLMELTPEEKKKSPEYKELLRKHAYLKTKSEQQFEKEKAEMVGKLKDLGNTVLGKFGMSLDNFQVQQQEGGGYSINFKK